MLVRFLLVSSNAYPDLPLGEAAFLALVLGPRGCHGAKYLFPMAGIDRDKCPSVYETLELFIISLSPFFRIGP